MAVSMQGERSRCSAGEEGPDVFGDPPSCSRRLVSIPEGYSFAKLVRLLTGVPVGALPRVRVQYALPASAPLADVAGDADVAAMWDSVLANHDGELLHIYWDWEPVPLPRLLPGSAALPAARPAPRRAVLLHEPRLPRMPSAERECSGAGLAPTRRQPAVFGGVPTQLLLAEWQAFNAPMLTRWRRPLTQPECWRMPAVPPPRVIATSEVKLAMLLSGPTTLFGEQSTGRSLKLCALAACTAAACRRCSCWRPLRLPRPALNRRLPPVEYAAGQTYEGEWDGRRVAVRRLRHPLLPAQYGDAASQQAFMRSAAPLTALRHPNLVEVRCAALRWQLHAV